MPFLNLRKFAFFFFSFFQSLHMKGYFERAEVAITAAHGETLSAWIIHAKAISYEIAPHGLITLRITEDKDAVKVKEEPKNDEEKCHAKKEACGEEASMEITDDHVRGIDDKIGENTRDLKVKEELDDDKELDKKEEINTNKEATNDESWTNAVEKMTCGHKSNTNAQ